MPFFFFFFPLSLLILLDGIKKTLYDIFAFNSNNSQIKHIAKKKIQTQRKKKKHEGLANKSMKISKYFLNFLISKRDLFDQTSN